MASNFNTEDKSTQLDPRFKIAYFLSSKKIESTLVLAFTGLLLSLGFLIGAGNNDNYALIYSFAGPIYWSVLFFGYGLSKLYSIWYKTSQTFRLVNAADGLWAWNYIFLSFAVFDKTPMAPTELLLLVPVVADMWIAMSAIHCKKEKVKKE